MKKKYVKLLTLAKNVDGGTGTFLFDFLKIRRLFNDRLETKVVIFEKSRYRQTDTFTFLHQEIFYPTRYSFLKAFKYFISDILIVKKIINEYKPDIILSINNYANIVLSLSSFFLNSKPKIIFTHHNNLYQIIKIRCSLVLREILRLLLPFLYKRANFHIAVSKGVSNDIVHLTRQKNIKVIYNGVIIKKLTHAKSFKKNKNIISIGRFDEQKDFFTLLRAFTELKKKIKSASLTLIGDGKDYRKISDYIHRLKIDKSLRLIKWQKNVNIYLKKSDLFLFSSNYEGFPYTIIEAMLCGLPIISTDTPFGPTEILDNGKYGILVPMEDPEKMAQAMYELLTNEKKYNYYAQKSIERVKYFSLDKMLKAYKKLILEVLNK